MTPTDRFNVLVEVRFLRDRILRAINDALEFAAEIAAPLTHSGPSRCDLPGPAPRSEH